jgi:type IV secretion system protein VirB8
MQPAYPNEVSGFNMNNVESKPESGAADPRKNEYYSEARGWEVSRLAMVERSERRAWMVAAVGLVVVTVSVGALTFLAPLKVAVPYVIYVDRFSGDAQVREAADMRTLQYSDVIDKHWVTEYVTSRERYYWEFLQSDYDRTMAFSLSIPAREYNRQFDGPNALYKRLGREQEYTVRILSVGLNPHAPGTAGTAVVRFEKTLRKLGEDQAGETARYIATVGFEYHVPVISSEKNLIANPLGFAVTAYRVDPELVDAAPRRAAQPQVVTPSLMIPTIPKATAPAIPGLAGRSVTGSTQGAQP